jgi:type II secretory pathway component PulJ
MRRAREETGLTLVELMVAASISLLILGGAMTLMISMWRGGVLTERHNDSSQQARQAVDRLARQLRNLASPSDTLTAASSTQPKSIERNEAFDLVFKDVDDGPLISPTLNKANVRRVRYCLQTSGTVPGGGTASSTRGVLWMQTQRSPAGGALPANPSADTTCPGAGWDDQRIVADSLTNARVTPTRPLFRYSESAGEITGTDAAARERIIRVASDVYVDPDPLRSPREAHLVSSVVLRNQNRVPTAAFTATAVGTCTVQLNGAASEDPENKRLTFRWYMDGALLSTGLQNRVVIQTSVSAGPHVFKLEVLDPAGLPSNPATQTFTAC